MIFFVLCSLITSVHNECVYTIKSGDSTVNIVRRMGCAHPSVGSTVSLGVVFLYCLLRLQDLVTLNVDILKTIDSVNLIRPGEKLTIPDSCGPGEAKPDCVHKYRRKSNVSTENWQFSFVLFL